MPKELYKKYPFASAAFTIVALLLFTSLVAGDDSVITNTILQLEWCGVGNYACVLFYHFVLAALIVLVGFVVDILFFRRLRESEKPAPSQTNTASGKSVAQQNVSNSPFNSFNTTNNWGNPILGYETPTRQQLLRKIGFDVQRFGEAFKIIRYKPLDEKFDQWKEAEKILKSIEAEPLRHANIELRDTPIPDLFQKISRELTRYMMQISNWSQFEADRVFYGKQRDSANLKVSVNRVYETQDTMKGIEESVDSMTKEILDLVVKYESSRNWTSF